MIWNAFVSAPELAYGVNLYLYDDPISGAVQLDAADAVLVNSGNGCELCYAVVEATSNQAILERDETRFLIVRDNKRPRSYQIWRVRATKAKLGPHE